MYHRRLTREELEAVYRDAGEEERALLRELVRSEDPMQAYVLAEILHYFPGTKLEKEER